MVLSPTDELWHGYAFMSFSTFKYAKIRYLDKLLNIKIRQVIFCHIFKILKYAIVLVLTNTSKYAYIRCHRLYAEIRSYLNQTQI